MNLRTTITAALCSIAFAASGEEASRFTRFVEDASGARLQTGVATFRNKDGVTVDIIGAIHIADKAYYEKLNARFTRYDALLYEMVGESFTKRKEWADARERADGTEKPSEDDLKKVREADSEAAASGNYRWLHPFYSTLERSLGLKGQLDVINYRAANFVHADMTAKQFAETQQKKNESFLSLWWKSVVVQMQHPDATPETPGLLKIIEILCSKDSKTELRRVIGRMFGSIDDVLSGLESEDGTVILTERNRVAVDVLQQQIKLGRKRLGIFYGSAHLPDMEKKLKALGFERVGSEWFTAWNMPPEVKQEPATANGAK